MKTLCLTKSNCKNSGRIDGLNEKFGNWEKIKRFELTPDIWSIEGGQLTPTLKLKENSYGKIYQIYSIKSTIM
jgi:long-chain acyl-CoA synthetase